LKDLVSKGQTPADRLLDGIENAKDLTAEIIARTDLGAG
jgi:hypothetical protein